MLYRKISHDIEEYLRSDDDKIMVLEGARQVGKSFIIREVGKRLFKNFVEINFVKDQEGDQLFKNIHRTEDFYLMLSSIAGKKLGDRSNTLIFLDEIQQYPHLLTMLKFLREEHRFRYIASGSLLGIVLGETTSIPVGSIIRKEMSQLDFEEFIIANDMGREVINHMRQQFERRESLSEELHKYVMNLFRRYLLVGGMPEVVKTYLETRNIVKVRKVQNDIQLMYKSDASKYEKDRMRRLVIRRIYDMVPSQHENKKKRIVAKDIKGKEGDRFSNYLIEFEYLISSGITLAVNAVSNPSYPLVETMRKNLIKLYLNDVGMFTAQIYGTDIQPILNDECSINLGTVYENVVAQQLKANGYNLFYYDNKSKGEVDFLIDDRTTTHVLPIEVKSGKDYDHHKALYNILAIPDYDIPSAYVLSNEREIKEEGGICYIPIYYIMFFEEKVKEGSEVIF